MSEFDTKKRLINDILQCVAANGVYISGEMFFGLAFRTVSELKGIARELHIQVDPV